VARNAERLAAGQKALAAKGVKAAAFTADCGDPDSVRAMVGKVRAELGPVTVLEWTAYGGGPVAGDITTADSAAVRSLFDVSVVGLVAAVQAVLPDLRQQKDAALLITNGGAGYAEPAVDAMLVQWGMMGLGISNAAKHKLVGLLAQKLKGDGIYVGEIMVSGAIKGTVFDQGNATIEAATVAAKFWEMYSARTDLRANIG
jgi:NADP-dependent 3-hydroxy acid dehydrogenase YdfG